MLPGNYLVAGATGLMGATSLQRLSNLTGVNVRAFYHTRKPRVFAKNISEFYPNAKKIIRVAEKMLKLSPADLSKEEFYSHGKRFKGSFKIFIDKKDYVF